MKNNLENKSKNGTRYCPKCNGKLRKNGHDIRKNQRWLCTQCGKTLRLKDERQHKEKVLRIFLDWILTKQTVEQAIKHHGISRTTFWRWKKEFFEILPEIAVTGEVYTSVIVDGMRIKGESFLVAKTPKFPIAGFFAPGETVEAYQILFSLFPQPEVVVCDGNKSIESAAKKTYNNPVIQRCFVHLFRYVRMQVGKYPSTTAKRVISNLTAKLFIIKTKEQAMKWEESFRRAYKRYDKEINDKRKCEDGSKRKYYWVNTKLHQAFHHVKYALEKGYLWNYLDYPEGVVPRDTNGLEGGINSNLKQLNFCHRGIKKDDEQKMLYWDLVRKSEFGLKGFIETWKNEQKAIHNET